MPFGPYSFSRQERIRRGQRGDSDGGCDKARIALGVTYDCTDLPPLLATIATTVRQPPLVLVPEQDRARHAVALARRAAPDPQVGPLLICYRDGVLTGSPLEATSPSVADLWSQLLGYERWMAPGLAMRLKRHMERQAVIIAVPLASRDLEQAICRILLNRTEAGLFIHDAPH